jgi:hypothetical protein
LFLLRLEKGRCHCGSGPLSIRDASLRPRRVHQRAPDNEKRFLVLGAEIRGDQQRLRCFDLLRLLQGFLGHFVSPSFDLPCWASAHVYAKQSPNFAVNSRIRNPLNLWHFASQLIRDHPAAPLHTVELIITR